MWVCDGLPVSNCRDVLAMSVEGFGEVKYLGEESCLSGTARTEYQEGG